MDSKEDWPKTENLRVTGKAEFASGAVCLVIETTGLDFENKTDVLKTREYLLSIIDRCKAEGFAGYVFVRSEDHLPAEDPDPKVN